MKVDVNKHVIKVGSKIKDALISLNNLSQDAILFVVDKNYKLLGSLTDGDVRRSLIKGLSLDSLVNDVIINDPKYIIKGETDLKQIISFRNSNLKVIPVLNKKFEIIDILNFRIIKSYIPVDAVVMAGGKGSRLMPLTKLTPKPLLKINNKCIIDYNIDNLISFGIDEYWISINYLGEKIQKHLGNGKSKDININYVYEDIPRGTIGAIKSLNSINDYVLITNSDILTKLNYEDFFLDFIKNNADMSVVTIPYHVSVPYGVLETKNNHIINLKEKPRYTYYSNAGIYLVKKEFLNLIPENKFYNATDLIEKLISLSKIVISFPTSSYWLDIGKHDDFKKAKEDIINLNF